MTSASPLALPAVAITVRPAARASWIAAVPTEPLPPCTRTVSPARTPAFWNSARQAVEQGTPTAAPCANESDGGSAWTLRASVTVSSA